ncbi:MAG: hypothetical protein JO314_06025 [Acidobacteria bacterium]|nr:hypothetical protein [Acidobacteriota bacterium]
MKLRLLAVATLLCLFANVVVLTAAQPGPGTKGRKVITHSRAYRLVPMLPASDGIVTFDARRFQSDGLPRLLEANSMLLGKVDQAIEDIQTKTGLDLRKFDEVALGVKITKKGVKDLDVDGVAIVSGDINAAAMVAVAKLASNGAYREEKIAGRTVYVFTVKDVANKAAATAANPKTATLIEKGVKEITTSIAVAAYDSNLLVIGSEQRVRETLVGNTHPSPVLTSLLDKNPSAIMNFAVKPPAGLDGMLPLANDELGKNLRSIQYLSGSADMTAAGASLSVAARTLQAEQAEGLKATLDGLQIMGTALLGGGKNPANQVYSRMIKSAKFSQSGNEVTLDLLVPQADIDTLISGIK